MREGALVGRRQTRYDAAMNEFLKNNPIRLLTSLVAVGLLPVIAQAQAAGAAPIAPLAAPSAAPSGAPLAAGATAATATAALILPPGQEPLIESLFAVEGFPSPQRVTIDQSRIVATWARPAAQLTVTRSDDQTQIDPTGAPTGAPTGTPTSAPTSGPVSAFAAAGLSGRFADTALSAAHVEALRARLDQLGPGLRWQAPAAGAGQGGRPQGGEGGTGGTDGADATATAQVRLLLQEAERSERIGEKEKALARLRQAMAATAVPAMTRARLGAALIRLGAQTDGQPVLDAALATLRGAADARGATPDDQITLVAALALADPPGAASKALAAVEATGDASDAACEWIEVARSLDLVGARDEAGKLAAAVTARAPRCKNAWLLRGGLVPHEDDGWKLALAIANEGLEHLPDDIDLLFLQGSALHGGWRNADAAAAWEKVAARDLHYPNVLGMLATAYTQQDEVTDDAFLARFQDRIAANPDDVPARYVAGTIHYYRGDYADVLHYLESLVSVVPDEPRVYLYTAMSHFHLGREEVALKRLDALDRLGHDDPDYYYCRSVMLRHRDFEQSLRDLETFVALSTHRLNSDAKVEKMNRELEVMRAGRVPNAFDLLPTPVRYGAMGGGALVLLLLAVWLARRGRRRASSANDA